MARLGRGQPEQSVVDRAGGEFLLYAQWPRAQSRAIAMVPAEPCPPRQPPRSRCSPLLPPSTSWQEPALGSCQEDVLPVEAISHGGRFGREPAGASSGHIAS